MILRFAALALCLGAFGCGPVVHTVSQPHPNYKPSIARAFDNGEIPLFLVGGAPEDAQRFADALSGWRHGVKMNFIPDGDTGASYGYRLVVRLEGRRGRVQEVCEIGLAAAPVEDDGVQRANLAFCRGGTPFTAVSAPVPDTQAADFAERVGFLRAALFPRETRDGDDDGDGFLF